MVFAFHNLKISTKEENNLPCPQLEALKKILENL